MALRITTPTAASTALADPPSDPFGALSAPSGSVSIPTNDDGLCVQNLLSRAAAVLLTEGSEAYLALFEEAATFTPQRRYQACKLLLERGLSAAASRDGRHLVELMVNLARGVLGFLEAEPAEPMLLNYAGVIFYELWSLDAANALFLATRRLDPELPHLTSNLESVRGRRRVQLTRTKGRRFPVLHADIAELSRRALRLAPRAQPARGLRMSLCMIVKDEEEMLGRCLAAVTPAVDEIIIVDTGSKDRTVEIAHEYGALVFEREWTGSFADARNASFDAATGDWVIYLDADEVLISDDVEKLRKLRGQTWREAFFLHETNFTGHEEAGVSVVHSALRVFRNRPEYRFSGRLHEQIASTLPTYLPERIAQSPVRVDHYGYLSSVRAAKDKSRRNVELLLRTRAEGGPVSPFDHFNLGSEYMALDDHAAAAEEFEKAWAWGRSPEVTEGQSGNFVPALAARLVSALRSAGQPDLALERATEGLEKFPKFTDLRYQLALACASLGRDAEAIDHLEQCIAMGDAPSRYTAVVGTGTFLPRITLAEMRMRTGDHDAALELLRWCATHHPGFYGLYKPYIRALLAAGRSAGDAIAEIESRFDTAVSSLIRFSVATELIERGALPEATAQLRDVLVRRPDNVPAMELLLETLLLAHDFEGFQAALAQFNTLDLEERTRRERLAQMYLRHGFLRSAAREWMAVVDTKPDAAALRGLAKVAQRNGQNETAERFSAEALKFSSD